jgi:cold shock CspA family protein
MQGYVVHFNDEKGYGFIKTKEHEENIFVHKSALLNTQILEAIFALVVESHNLSPYN